MAQRHFEGLLHAKSYLKYRPTYPKELFERIVQYVKNGEPTTLGQAVDVGCGSGQSTTPLASHFNKVVGVDVSPAQVLEANQNNSLQNVSYREGCDSRIPAADNSCQLVTCATAAHWFDLPKFYAETDRVLSPAGCIAIYCYTFPEVQNVTNAEEINEEVQKLYLNHLKGYYYDESHDMYFGKYTKEKFTIPYGNMERDESLNIDVDMSLLDFFGYISTWSGYQNYLKKTNDDSILKNMTERVMDIMNETKPSEEVPVHIQWPCVLLLGRKPSNTS